MKRSEQKEHRKNEILIKSINLFVTKGYRETKITDIASSVGMSVGLLFHYFESKEDLYYELVKMGVEVSKSPEKLGDLEPEEYFTELLKQLFEYAAKEPWVFQMFVLMNQARKDGVPAKIRKLANTVNQVEFSAKIIEKGQKQGVFRDGEAKVLSACFWSSVQGIMEQMAADTKMNAPNPEWLVSILRK